MLTSPNTPRSRLIILGASNVARAIGSITQIARNGWPGPLDLVLAMGHGRSFGISTWAPFRRLPAILDCGLWNYLAHQEPLPTGVLFTDIGNDLLFGKTPKQIMQWVRECHTRLQPAAGNWSCTALPLSTIRVVSHRKYYLFRSLFFPKSTLELTTAQAYAEELNDLLRAFVIGQGGTLVEPARAWYGFDPIHVRFQQQSIAWSVILASLRKNFSCSENNFSLSWRERNRLFMMRAERSEVRNSLRYVPQPSVLLHEGTRVSFF